MLEAAHQHRRLRAAKPCKLDGHAEAHPIALSRSAPPKGRDRWTLQLLADTFVAPCYGLAISDK